MKTAMLKQTPGSSGLRFEVQSTPTRGHHGIQRWYIKANHPVEASRWIQALHKSIEWARREADRASVESEVSSLLAPSVRGSISTYHRRSHQSSLGGDSVPSSIAGDEPSDSSSPLKESSADDPMADTEGEKTERSSVAESEHQPPHHLSFELHGNSTLAQMELTTQMLADLPVTPTSADLKSAMADSLHSAQTMLAEYVTMARAREEWYKEKLERERERQNVWEESLQAVVKEGELMERELRNKARANGRRVV